MPEPKSAVDHDELARSAIERSRLYGLLSTVFSHEPSAEFLAHLNTPELVVAFSCVGIDLGDEFRRETVAELADDLAVEYTRLFLGPGKHISPHESVQLKRGSGILWGPETPAVRAAYQAAGFDIDEDETEIPDHLGVELGFLSHLAGEEAQSWQDHDQEQAAGLLYLQHKFISEHLGKWVAEFCRNVKEEADLTFYAAFADLLHGYLSGEKSEIARRLELAGVDDVAKSRFAGQDSEHFKLVKG